MPASKPRQVIEAYLGDQRRILSCITQRYIQDVGWRDTTPRRYLSFGSSRDPVLLWAENRRRRFRFFFEIAHQIVRASEEEAAVDVTAYYFELSDREGREILAYHWHPEGVSPITGPHLHLSGRLRSLDVGAQEEPLALGGIHLTTGVVTLAQVVHLLITEFGVEPRRDDWETVLRSSNPG